MRYVVDDIETVVNALKEVIAPATLESTPPYYMYGHRAVISKALSSKDKDAQKKFQKYPLIALRLDVPEDVADGVEYTLNIVIAGKSKLEYTTPQRYANVIKPILVPLYEAFLLELRNSGLFMWSGTKNPPHTKIDRPFWGIEETEQNGAYIFNDCLDAIELVNLKINSTNKKC